MPPLRQPVARSSDKPGQVVMGLGTLRGSSYLTNRNRNRLCTSSCDYQISKQMYVYVYVKSYWNMSLECAPAAGRAVEPKRLGPSYMLYCSTKCESYANKLTVMRTCSAYLGLATPRVQTREIYGQRLRLSPIIFPFSLSPWHLVKALNPTPDGRKVQPWALPVRGALQGENSGRASSEATCRS